MWPTEAAQVTHMNPESRHNDPENSTGVRQAVPSKATLVLNIFLRPSHLAFFFNSCISEVIQSLFLAVTRNNKKAEQTETPYSP